MWGRVIKDNFKACIPCKHFLRSVFRKVSPYHSLSANDQFAFEHGLQLVRFIQNYKIGLTTVLEVGTGWIPTIPHMLKACGAEKLILTDIERLSDPATFSYASKMVQESIDRLAEVSAIDEKVLHTNLLRPDVEEHRCPPRLEELKNNTVSLVYSRTVLEHIAEPMLTKLLIEWKRLLFPGAFCIHFIDNSDHFEHRDKTLSRINFLSMSSWAWKLACFNPQNYQNRLRHSDYLKLFRAAGYEILHVEGNPDAKAMADLGKMTIAKQFVGYDKADLAILTSIIVARKPVARESSALTVGSGSDLS